MEIWKAVYGFEGSYEVSSIGRIKSLYRTIDSRPNVKRSVPERILKPNVDKDGYETVILQKEANKKTLKVHRLVAIAFFGNSDLCVNHIDGNKKNNNVSNLEFVTVGQNNIHARRLGLVKMPRGPECYNYRLTPEIRCEIKSLRGQKSYIEIARIYDIHPMTVYKVWRVA